MIINDNVEKSNKIALFYRLINIYLDAQRW